MVDESRALAVLAVMIWAALVALVIAFLRIWLRPDAGFGAAGRGGKPGPPGVGAQQRAARSAPWFSRVSHEAPRR
jgi:hypothetical protein